MVPFVDPGLPFTLSFARVGWLVRAVVHGSDKTGREFAVPGDPFEASQRQLDEGAAIREGARAAADGGAAGGRGSDSSGAVTVSLDGAGRVAGVQIAAGWRGRVDAGLLGEAVREAVLAAAVARLAAWGESYADEGATVPGPAVDGPLGGESFAEQLQQAATARMSAEDGRAALLELLAMAEELERGIDEVSARLQSTVDATHTGRSADRHVTVTVTGGGAVTGVRYDRNWLLEAHEINIGRQTLSAFTAAYESAARTGVGQLIAESSLGEVQRAAQDPFGLARRLRLHD
jgi:DNA-binding protein YbaB